MRLSSPAFAGNGAIPVKYTCMGENVNPPLIIENPPAKARSLVLIFDDPDAPSKTWVHWVMFNIPVTGQIRENSVPGTPGRNDSDQGNGYSGPCPSSGTHRYFFKLYALDIELDLPAGVDKKTVEKAMLGHVVDKTELVGIYGHAGQ